MTPHTVLSVVLPVLIGVVAFLVLIGTIRTVGPIRNALFRLASAITLSSSVSIWEVRRLAAIADDRHAIFKDYFGWQHKVVSGAAAALGTFILGNVLLLIKVMASDKEAIGSVLFLDGSIAASDAFGIVLALMVAWLVSIIGRLRRIPEEYLMAVTLYERMRP
jgi:hypothetical protein